MPRRYVFFYTAKAAVFQFYALVVLLVLLAYVKLTQHIPQSTVFAGTMLYVVLVVFYSFHIDRANRGNRGQ